ncbi:BTAD domain-containing putative transcriptional regulator [Streptomyces sp. SP17BM10]
MFLAGQREALEVHQRLRATLVRELGMEPSGAR